MTLAPEGAKQQTVSLGSVAQALRVSDRQYSVRGGPQGDTTITISGVTLDRLLDQAGIDPFGFEDVEISGGGRSVVLTRNQVTDVDAFPEGRPIFWVDAQGTHFLRPSAGSADTNAADLLTSADGSLRVALHSGGDLIVAATASRLRVRRGQRVTFSATVHGPGSDQAPVSWYFDDGRSARGRRVTHRFARAGSYDITVSAGAGADRVGADDVLTLQVGGQRQGGPDRKGGGTNTAAGAPDSGASGGAAGAADGGATSEPAPPRPAPSPVPEPKQAQPRPSTPELKDLAGAPTSGASESVEGILLSDASPTPTLTRAEALAAARTGTPKRPQAAAAGSVPPVVWGSLIALALLGLGAWRERRGVPRRRQSD